MVTRSFFLLAAGLAWAQPHCIPDRTTRCAPATDRPLVGAIRWDAWHGKQGSPGLAVERALGPAKWHYRLPFFAQVVGENAVSIDGASQEIMDREIGYAADAGLDYWAFGGYDPDNAMTIGLRSYISSAKKNRIRFCLWTQIGHWGTRANYRERLRYFANLMAMETYQKVLDGRPLLYFGFITDASIQSWGSAAELRAVVDELRGLVKESGAGNPYIVILEFNPARGHMLREALGADAISAYAAQGGEAGAPYSALAAYAQRFWERQKATGSEVVPVVMAGWDRRPRVEHPVPWEKQEPGVGIEKYYESPTPAELAGHLERSLLWIQDNPAACPAKAALIYAWNENDEGGWLTPTLCDGNVRLDAVRGILRRTQ